MPKIRHLANAADAMEDELEDVKLPPRHKLKAGDMGA